MSKSSKVKGSRLEREVVAVLRAHGFSAHRVPLSGSLFDYKDDVVLRGLPHLKETSRVEVKGRKTLKGIYGWLGKADLLWMRQDRDQWLVVQRAQDWLAMAGGKPGAEVEPDDEA